MQKDFRSHEWPQLQKLGLCRDVRSFEDYVKGVTEGEAEAALLTVADPRPVPSVEYIRRMHRTLFERVHPWAGEFNKDGEDVWFGGMLSCDPLYIEDELLALIAQTESLIFDSQEHANVRSVAFFHAKFERIHPFRDGNGRVGRILLDSQMNALFGLKATRGPITSNAYHWTVVEAQRKSNLRPLINCLLRWEGLPELPNEHEQPPFRMRLNQSRNISRKMERRRLAKNREH